MLLSTSASLVARVGFAPSGPRAAGSVASAPQAEAASVLFADGRAGAEPTASASAWAGAQQPISGLLFERTGHTATNLGGGRVLFVGGTNRNGEVRDAEAYNPATKDFSLAAGMLTA